MIRVALVLAAGALNRAADKLARAARVPVGATVAVRLGRWYVQRESEHSTVVAWPREGDEWTEYPDAVERGPVVTVAWEAPPDGGSAVHLMLTRDEATGAEAERLRAQSAEREAAWWRENGSH